MGLKDLKELYNFLFDFGMIIVIDILKYEGQWPSSKYVLAMLMILFRYALFLMIFLKYLHERLFGSRVDKLLYLVIELMNSSSENGS